MADSQSVPAIGAVAVTPNDSADISTNQNGAPVRSLYIGTGGDLKVKTGDGDIVSFVGLSGGTILPVYVTRVYATGQPGTIAANIIALY
jgi:hypothetical protein